MVTILVVATTVSGSYAASPTPSATKNPYGASVPVDPAGPNEIILTVTNHSKVVKFSMNTLRKLGTTEVSIYEPFVKVRQKFTVVALAKIFKSANILPGATIATDALNDYIYTDSARNFINSSGQLAIARFSAPIPYDQGGPIRIIFPDSSPLAKNLNAWNWSLSSMTVK